MTRTRVWYALALAIGALGPVGWFFLAAEPVAQAFDGLVALIVLPVSLAMALVVAGALTSGVRMRDRLFGVALAAIGLAGWVAYALNRPWDRLI